MYREQDVQFTQFIHHNWVCQVIVAELVCVAEDNEGFVVGGRSQSQTGCPTQALDGSIHHYSLSLNHHLGHLDKEG